MNKTAVVLVRTSIVELNVLGEDVFLRSFYKIPFFVIYLRLGVNDEIQP